MQIILVHPRFRQARTIVIGRGTVTTLALALLLALASASGLLSYVMVRHAAGAQLPWLQQWLPQPAPLAADGDERVRHHIDALAVAASGAGQVAVVQRVDRLRNARMR